MARIKEFFATEKITPNDRGTAAFEQAGRRIGGFYEQIARAREQVGNDVGKLWNEVKFALDAEVDRQENLYKLARGTEQNSGGGGERGGVRVAGGGKASDPFGLNGEGEFRDRGANGVDGNPNLPNEYNSPTVLRGRGGSEAANVGRAAEGLPSIIRKVILGQGLTDDERKIYNASGYGQKHTDRGYELNNNPKTGGIAPNPDVSYDDAVKAGYNGDTLAKYGSPIPVMTSDRNSSVDNLFPNIEGTTTDPDLQRIQSGGPEALPSVDKKGNVTFSDDTPDWARVPGGMAGDTAGGSIWNNIVQQVGTLGGLWPMDNSGGGGVAPAAIDESADTGADDNPVQ